MPDNVNCSVAANTTGDYNPTGDNSTWVTAVDSMGKWYEQNVHTYWSTKCKPRGNRKAYNCPLIGGKLVYDDCSSFVTACIRYFNPSIYDSDDNPPTSHLYDSTTSNIGKSLAANGFVHIPFDFNKLQPYDIISQQGHVEIVANVQGFTRSWGWGSVHDRDSSGCGKPFPGMPAGNANGPLKGTCHGVYTTIWRYVGN